MDKILLTDDQRYELEKQWFIFGNHGPKTTMNNHKFIQGLLDYGEDLRDLLHPSQECMNVVDKILGK